MNQKVPRAHDSPMAWTSNLRQITFPIACIRYVVHQGRCARGWRSRVLPDSRRQLCARTLQILRTNRGLGRPGDAMFGSSREPEFSLTSVLNRKGEHLVIPCPRRNFLVARSPKHHAAGNGRPVDHRPSARERPQYFAGPRVECMHIP
jgi:hypothetical protein